MLPARSKRFALTEDGGLPRLKLTEGWQLVLIALIMLGLFVVIFPHQTLVQKLYSERKMDELTSVYIDNLHRTEPDNPDVMILLARSKEKNMDVASMENLLFPVIARGTLTQRREARRALIDRYGQAMQVTQDEARAQRLRGKSWAVLETASTEPYTQEDAFFMADAAFQAEQPQLMLKFLLGASDRKPQSATHDLASWLMKKGQQALAQGRYELASQCFLMARQQTGNTDETRKLFRQGIDALMANSQYAQALQAADQNLGDLGDDAATLRYLVRTALAAGFPKHAADYARRLLFTASEAGL